MTHRKTGSFLRQNKGERYTAYLPSPLPPDPPIQFDSTLWGLAEKANRSLGRLDAVTDLLPDTAVFIYFYIRREALLSSQIEGTRSTFSELILFENDDIDPDKLDEVREVSNYVAALDHGLARLNEGFPLSLRLIRELHGVLLKSGRGAEQTPGEFRRSQNWVGGSRPGNAQYVPPPPEHLMECMGNLETFLHTPPEDMPILLKAGLAHVQFESIHPFLDGNGRLGRLLITLMLCAEGVLQEPTLYLSLFFKEHRENYYELLQRVRTEGDWEAWLRFFLEGVQNTASQAVDLSKRIIALFQADQERIKQLGRSNAQLFLHDALKKNPLMNLKKAEEMTGLAYMTLKRAFEALEQEGIVQEISGRSRGKVYAYQAYWQLLSEGTEPL